MASLTKDSPIVTDARALYMAFEGRQHRLIEAAMRARGWKRFSRRVLYGRTERGKTRPGWVQKFGWMIERPVSSQSSENVASPNNLASPASVETDLKADVESPNEFKQFVQDEQDINSRSHPAYPVYPVDISSVSEADPQTVWVDPMSPERRRAEIRELRKWLQSVSPKMRWDWVHLRYLYRKLADVTTGRTKRLMIFMPPRHGKSELVTVHYPAYRLKQDPKLNVIVASYNQKLANRFSRKIRLTWEDSMKPETRDGRKDDLTGMQGIKEMNGINEGDETPAPPPSLSSPSSLLNGSVSNASLSPVSQSPVSTSSSRSRLNTVSEWETGPNLGGVRAVGVGAGITGYGAKLVIIDDPIRSRSEAESETCRNRTWEWFNDDLYTRLEPDAAMILIQTRWHEDDLAGRLLQEMKNGGEKWEVVSLPAIAENETGMQWIKEIGIKDINDKNIERPVAVPSLASSSSLSNKETEETGIQGMKEINDSTIKPVPVPSFSSSSSLLNIPDPIGRFPGDALCPDRFPVSELARIRRQLGEYSFAALYQQRPQPLEGGLFKKKWFTQIVDRAPEGLRWFRGYDLAISTKTSADYTASARCAMDRSGNIYISDVFRARLEYPEQRKYVVDRMRNERDTEHGIEKALHAQAFVQDLRREPTLARHAIRLVSVTSDKFTRALAWANRAEERKIILVRGPWLNQFLEEVCSFPNSTHDDQVDAVSIAIQMMESRKRQFWRF